MIIKSIFLNSIGIVLPIVVSFPLLGMIARMVDVEKFGVFLIFFSFVGFSSFLDLGLSRAIVREVAKKDSQEEEKKKIIQTASIFVFFIGLIFSLVSIYFVDEIVDFLNLSESIVKDVRDSFIIVNMSIPFVLISGVWSALPEGELRFLSLSAYKSISGVLLILIPFSFAIFSASLISLAAGLIVARILTAAMSFWYVRYFFYERFSFDYKLFKNLIGYGGWLTVTNIVGPLMVYGDRFLLSNLLGAKSVGFYTAASELISRLLIVPSIVAKPLYPLYAFDQVYVEKRERLIKLSLAFVVFFVVIFVYLFSDFFVTIWLGERYSVKVVNLIQILLVGFFFNSIAQTYYIKIQALGHSDIVAIIHLTEIVPYGLVFYFLVDTYGLNGAAWAWSIRSAVDCLFMVFVAKRSWGNAR